MHFSGKIRFYKPLPDTVHFSELCADEQNFLLGWHDYCIRYWVTKSPDKVAVWLQISAAVSCLLMGIHQLMERIIDFTEDREQLHEGVSYFLFSSLKNLPFRGLMAPSSSSRTPRMNTGSISVTGMPVSIFSCANAPFPVTTSPRIEAAKPSCASRPTNSSLAFVNAMAGPGGENRDVTDDQQCALEHQLSLEKIWRLLDVTSRDVGLPACRH